MRSRAGRAARRVAHDVAVLLEVGEEDAQHRERVVDRLGRQVAVADEPGDVAADVARRHGRRLHRPEERLQAFLAVDAVVLVRAGLDPRAVLLEPGVEALGERAANGDDLAAVDGGHRLRAPTEPLRARSETRGGCAARRWMCGT
jgi:hypothetical protein